MGLRYEFDILCTDVITHNARVYADRTAVVCDSQRLSWKELEARTNQVANAIRSWQFEKGDKVALLMSNSIAMFEWFWGIAKSGCVIVTLNTMLDDDSFARLVTASDARAIIVDESMRPLVDRVRAKLHKISSDRFFVTGAAEADWASSEASISAADTSAPGVKLHPFDSMTIIFSSGTTGVPKGIEHSHFGRMNYPLGFGMGLCVDRYSVAICATPMYASGTWITMFPTMYRGGTVVLVSRYNPEAFLRTVERERATHCFLVPTQYIGLLQQQLQNFDTSSLKVLVTAGQILSDVTFAALRQHFPAAGLYEVYGMTEGFATLAIPEDSVRGKRGSVGKPALLEDIRIIDESGCELTQGETGEIVAHGPGMMKGYYNRPDLTDAATWVSPSGRTYMRSGDIGRLDADGYLYVMGRLKEMIKSGGINIYAADLEGVLMQHSAVKEAAVVGIPHEKWGETPVAVVLLKSQDGIESAALLEWANERLAKYQRLSRLLIADELPRATYGKIQKQSLTDQVIARLSQAEHDA